MTHHHRTTNFDRLFAIGIGLNIAYVVVEAGFGLLDGSLALLSDAGHNLSDVIGLLLAWTGHTLSRIAPTRKRTYGWRGTSILAALFNAILLLGAVGAIAWEAVRRLTLQAELPGTSMIAVAALGVVINTATALLFVRGRHHDLNIRGAFLHMAADAAVSLGVVAAGLIIRATGWSWVDPATGLIIATVIFVSTWDLLRKSLNLAVQAVPSEIDPHAVLELLTAIPGVTEVHDLHIWAISTTETALTAHLVKPQVENEDALLRDVTERLHHQFGIEHATIQIERTPCETPCSLEPGS